MKPFVWGLIFCAMGIVVCDASAGGRKRSVHSIGGGVHYAKVVQDVEIDDIEEDGLGWYASYQYRDGVTGAFEFDFESMPSGFAGSEETLYAPQAYLLAGKKFYGGPGIGWYFSDGDWADDPFFALRFGFNIEIASGLILDINGNYRFSKWDTNITKNIDTDTVTLAAALRVDL